MNSSFFTFLVRIKSFLRENPSALFVLSFQVLLALCAVLLVFGLSFLAEGVAVVAYFLLVAGVVLLLVRFAKDAHGREASE
jgi:hypothetical protein